MSSSTSVTNPDEQALYCNLCLLGIPSQALKNGIEISRQSFRKPNPRGLELVLFYLYAAICGEAKANKDFRGMCPIPDKSQSKEFNQRVTDWFKDLKEKHQLESIGSMTASQVRSATGHRAVSALLELSTLALLLEYQRLSPESARSWNFKAPPEKDPKFLPELAHVLPSLGAVAIKMQAQQFTALMYKAAAAQETYESCANEFKDQFYHLRSQCQQLQYARTPGELNAVEEHIQAQALQPGTFAPLPPLLSGSVEPSLAFQHASDTMTQLEEHLQQYEALGGLMHDTVGSTVHPYAVDGGKLAQLAAAGASATLSADGTYLRPHVNIEQLVTGSGSGGAVAPAFGGAGADVDVGVMLEQWVSSLEACCPLIEALAGQGQGVSPLAAPSHVSSSHAALLGTQLKARKAAVDNLTTMKAALQAQHFSTDRLLQEMPSRLAHAMATKTSMIPSATPSAKSNTLHVPSSHSTQSSSKSKAAAYGPAAVMGPIVHGLPPTPIMAAQQAKRGTGVAGGGPWPGMGAWKVGGTGGFELSPFPQEPQLHEGRVQGLGSSEVPLPMFGREQQQGQRQQEQQQQKDAATSGSVGQQGLRPEPSEAPQQPVVTAIGGDAIQGSQTHDLGLLSLDDDDDDDGGFGGLSDSRWSLGDPDSSAMKDLEGRASFSAFNDPDLKVTPMNFFK